MITILLAGSTATVVCFYIFRYWNRETAIPNKDSQEGKFFLVTGANSGLGKETVRELAIRNATVILACRNLKSAEETIAEIRRTVSSGKLTAAHLDLASFKSISSFAKTIASQYPKIHVLINNAGVSLPAGVVQKTQNDIELQFGVNYVGHFLLTHLLLEKLKSSAPSRVVNVSSLLHKGGVLDFEDLDGTKKNILSRGFMHPGYGNSKLANVYHTIELANRLKGTGVDAYVLSPGFCYTGLMRNTSWMQFLLMSPILFLFTRSARNGAQTIVYCATENGLKSGGFYRDCKPYESPLTFDPAVASRLWEETEALIKLKAQSQTMAALGNALGALGLSNNDMVSFEAVSGGLRQSL